MRIITKSCRNTVDCPCCLGGRHNPEPSWQRHVPVAAGVETPRAEFPRSWKSPPTPKAASPRSTGWAKALKPTGERLWKMLGEGDGGSGWRVPGPVQGQLQQDSPLPLLMSNIVASAPHPSAPDPNHPRPDPEKQAPEKPLATFEGMRRAQSRPARAPRHQNFHASLLLMFSVCNEKVRNARQSRMDPQGTRRTDTEPRLRAGSPASVPAFFISFKGIDILPGIVPIPSNQQDFLPQWKVSIRYLATSSFSDLFASPKPLSPPPTA